MAILDFLKNKNNADTTKSKSKKTDRKVSVEKKEEVAKVKPEFVTAKNVVNNGKFSYEAVKQPHISEKATGLMEENQYIFKVLATSNKYEIKKSVEGIYGVKVLSVNKIKIPAKKRRLGKTEGFRKAYQKAIVKIKEGQKIEIL